jgi:hypothetical protein
MNNTPSLGGEPQPPPPLNLSGGGGVPPPPLKLYVGPPPPLNLKPLVVGRTPNYVAFSNADKLSKEEGTNLEIEFTTSPSLPSEEREIWEEERRNLEEKARIPSDDNPKRTIKFSNEKPVPHIYHYPSDCDEGNGGGDEEGNEETN